MPGSFKTEAIVLRSIRYGEADRVLHLYTPDRGRVGAVAKGVRRVRSRMGGRLEPLSRVRLVLHEGRGELCTVSQADTVARPRRPARAARLARARHPGLRGGAAAARLDRAQPARLQPALPRAGAARRGARGRHAAPRRSPSASSCCWPPASRPSWRPAPPAARPSTSAAFSPSAGGVVCAGCEAGSFPLAEEAHRFLVDRAGQAAGRGARRRPSRPSRRPTGRSRRRSSTTPTCDCAAWPRAYWPG